MDLEAVEARHELVGRPLGPVLGVHHEQHVREPRAEVRAVRVVVSAKKKHKFKSTNSGSGLQEVVFTVNGINYCIGNLNQSTCV